MLMVLVTWIADSSLRIFNRLYPIHCSFCFMV